MSRRMSVLIALALVVSASLLAGTGAIAAGSAKQKARAAHEPCRNADVLPSPGNSSLVVAATLCLIEREREAFHLGVLRPNGSLQRIAASQARDMVIGDYFGDDTPTGGTPWQRITASHYATDARILSVAQNIGWGTGELATPAAIVNTWMLSPPHRQIMLTGYFHDIGVGMAPAAPSSLNEGMQGATYTVEFAARG